MKYKRILRCALLTLAVLAGSKGYAQNLLLPAALQVPTPPYASPKVTAESPTTYCACHDNADCSPNEDNNGTTLYNDPLLSGRLVAENEFVPGPLTSGWFASLEAGLVDAHVNQQMHAYVGPFTTGAGFHIDSADLGWNVSPVFQFGYRLEQGAGEIICTYQYVAESGTAAGSDAFGNTASVSSHLSVNSFDLAYASSEFSLGPWCDMKWLIGIRVANVYFDAQSTSIVGAQSAVNNFVGVGPVAGLNLGKRIHGTGLDIFVRSECGMLYGPDSQFYNAGGGATVNQEHNNLVFVPKVEAGLGWSPEWNERLHFAAGYTFQYWSNIAEQSPQGAAVGPQSRGDLVIQGIFFRGEWNF
jgi:hypothetical protein